MTTTATGRLLDPRHARTLAAAVATAGLALLPAVASASDDDPDARRPAPGSAGIGDPYFPLAGNGGIDVEHYDLELSYTPPGAEPAPLTGHLEGIATIELTATADLSRFNLDLRDLTATRVTVDGRRARFTQEPNELVITPRRALEDGDEVEVVVEYGGVTGRPLDSTGALYGWVTTRDGAMVANEPDGAATWFPANDHPTDKATFTFDVTVPKGLVAVANGLLDGRRTRDGLTTWSWDAGDDLMAPYLATASIGNYRLERSRAEGVPIIDAVDEDLTSANAKITADTLTLTGEMIEFFEDVFGDYPFVAYGSIVDDDTVDYALETQTRSLFSLVADEVTAAHELAHSWVGNAVSPYRWADIWLNEGWATYSEQLWTEHRGGTTAQAQFDALMARPATDPLWSIVVADPGAQNMFAAGVYLRGAGTLHALRMKIGDAAFFELAEEWVEIYDDATASTADFEALAEEVSGQDLDAFFDVWLHTAGRPTTW
jgi:aminopeptidase N